MILISFMVCFLNHSDKRLHFETDLNEVQNQQQDYENWTDEDNESQSGTKFF
jgi:hypothetical protein